MGVALAEIGAGLSLFLIRLAASCKQKLVKSVRLISQVQLTKNAVLNRGESPNGWLAKLSNLLFNSSFLLSRLSLW